MVSAGESQNDRRAARVIATRRRTRDEGERAEGAEKANHIKEVMRAAGRVAGSPGCVPLSFERHQILYTKVMQTHHNTQLQIILMVGCTSKE